MGLFFFQLLLHLWVTTPASAEPEDTLIRTLAKSPGWKGLLQYQVDWMGKEKSEVDGKGFFLSDNGNKNPEDELRQTLQEFFKPVEADQNQHALCRFPARFRFLKESIEQEDYWKGLPAPECTTLSNYLVRIQRKKVSVVFTSYHPASAASVFGHSFLKFSGDNENELFDTGINFAANPTTSNPALYALYGLIGLFPSSFSAQPFYHKVREYNDSESRDLWLYELSLTQHQIDRLILHLWELGNTHFDYFYFNENCSYQILRAIEGSLPEVRFFKSRPVYLIPSESIKALYSIPGIVRDVRYRPSLFMTAKTGYERLADQQQKSVRDGLKQNGFKTDDPAVLDVLIDTSDLTNDPSKKEEKEILLRSRSTATGPGAIRVVTPPEHERPDLGHGSRRIRLGPEWSRSGGEWRLNHLVEARAAHHDLMDPSIGYPRHLQIDFGRIGVRVQPELKRAILNELTLVDIIALSPDHPLLNSWSYAIKIGYSRRWVSDCHTTFDCGSGSIRAGMGRALTWAGSGTLYGMLSAEPSYSGDFTGSKWKLDALPMIGLIWEWTPSIKTRIEAASRYDFTSHIPWSHTLRLEQRLIFANQLGMDLEIRPESAGPQIREVVALNGIFYF